MMASTAFAAGGGETVAADPTKHFDPKGKPPSQFTIELQNGLRKTLPFEDKRDFEEAKKGFIAAPPYKQIMAEAGNVAWDMLMRGTQRLG
jgi:alkyl sulfatase BDS1-like metallo-beta-lactamase superfamily hydrolase